MAHRCSVCDRTDDKKVTVLSDQFFSGPYLKDTRSDGEICQECVDSINEVIYESEEDDDPILPFRNY